MNNLTTEQVQDVIGAMVSSNTESGITVAYDDSDGTLDFTVGPNKTQQVQQHSNNSSSTNSITSLGTLTSLTVDDITINGSTITDSWRFNI